MWGRGTKDEAAAFWMPHNGDGDSIITTDINYSIIFMQ